MGGLRRPPAATAASAEFFCPFLPSSAAPLLPLLARTVFHDLRRATAFITRRCAGWERKSGGSRCNRLPYGRVRADSPAGGLRRSLHGRFQLHSIYSRRPTYPLLCLLRFLLGHRRTLFVKYYSPFPALSRPPSDKVVVFEVHRYQETSTSPLNFDVVRPLKRSFKTLAGEEGGGYIPGEGELQA